MFWFNYSWAKLPKSKKLDKSKNNHNFVKIVSNVAKFCSSHIVKFDFGLKNKGMGLGLGIGMEISARSFAVLMIIEPYGILLGHHVLISLNVTN